MKLLVISDYKNSYRQGMQYYESISLPTFVDAVQALGDSAEVMNVEYFIDQVVKAGKLSMYPNIMITSSQNREYKLFLEDYVYFLEKSGVNVIPNYELFRAHENKGFQELIKTRLSISSCSGTYKCFPRNRNLANTKVDRYLVYKLPSGAGSKHVKLLKIGDEIPRDFNHISLTQKVKHHLKKCLALFKITYVGYGDEAVQFSPYVLQEFVPGLENDWKVLVFGKRAYALKRYNRQDDFRASGSGNFQFEQPPYKLIQEAMNIKNRLNAPFVSLDLAITEDQDVHLIEFQATHFGPYTMLKSSVAYEIQEGRLVECQPDPTLEHALARAIHEFYPEVTT